MTVPDDTTLTVRPRTAGDVEVVLNVDLELIVEAAEELGQAERAYSVALDAGRAEGGAEARMNLAADDLRDLLLVRLDDRQVRLLHAELTRAQAAVRRTARAQTAVTA